MAGSWLEQAGRVINATGTSMLGQVATVMWVRGFGIRPCKQFDLDYVNRLIQGAVMAWILPDRVKRLMLPVCRYTRQDPIHLDMVVKEDQRLARGCTSAQV
jgi:hypothetical protein